MKPRYAFFIILALCLTVFSRPALPLFDFNFPNNEETVIKISHSNGTVGTRICNVTEDRSNYVFKTIEEDGSATRMVVDKATLKPIVFKATSSSGKVKNYARYYDNNKMYLAIPGSGTERMIDVPSDAVDKNSLDYILRSFPFREKEIFITLIMHDEGNIRNTRMQVKNMGVEEVEGIGGKFLCYKLEMGCANPIERLVWPHKYYFWYTVRSPHYFVRFEGRDIDMSTVTNELLSYKVGERFFVKAH